MEYKSLQSLRGALRTFNRDGELHRMQACVLDAGGNLIRIQREVTINHKSASYPITEWINLGVIHGITWSLK